MIEMINSLLILLVFLLYYLANSLTRNRIILWGLAFLLPLIPDVTGVVMEMNELGFWLQFLTNGHFILTLLGLPALIYLVFLFGALYSMGMVAVFIGWYIHGKRQKNKI